MLGESLLIWGVRLMILITLVLYRLRARTGVAAREESLVLCVVGVLSVVGVFATVDGLLIGVAIVSLLALSGWLIWIKQRNWVHLGWIAFLGALVGIYLGRGDGETATYVLIGLQSWLALVGIDMYKV